MDNLRLYTYQGYTLVDITNTGIIKFSAENEKKRNQQRNWESIIQVLSLRTQLMKVRQFDIISDDVNNHQFGDMYQGIHKIWGFEFSVEYPDVYKVDSNPYGILINDFSKVPINIELDETVSFPVPVFYTNGIYKNIYFNFLN